jgi:cytochrome c oxidase subunit 3
MGATMMPVRPTVRGVRHSTAASTGVWVGVATISMSFAAYTSAMVVRQGASGDWLHFRLPSILYLNTLLILASSVTLELARRNHAHGPIEPDSDVLALPGPVSRTTTWISVTLGLGLLFLLGQVMAWRQLAAQGLFLATNPSSAFFYILTGLHGLHLLGGLCGLLYVRHRLRRGPAVEAGPALGAGVLYWHFMAVLWVYLLLLLVVRL